MKITHYFESPRFSPEGGNNAHCNSSQSAVEALIKMPKDSEELRMISKGNNVKLTVQRKNNMYQGSFRIKIAVREFHVPVCRCEVIEFENATVNALNFYTETFFGTTP